MANIVMGEKWNTIDSSDMALGVRRAINETLRKRSLDEKCRKSILRGIEFLAEAEAGGALISGESGIDTNFHGSFSPLCLATDVYITFANSVPDKSEDYCKVNEQLEQYRCALEHIRDRKIDIKKEEDQLKKVGVFFKKLYDLLLQQVDPTMGQYSHAF